MPRKAATPAAPPPAPVPAAPPAAGKKTRKPRAKAQSEMNAVALWVGDNPKPKHWFDDLNKAKAFLASGQLKHKEGEVISIAELHPVALRFTVDIGGDAPIQ